MPAMLHTIIMTTLLVNPLFNGTAMRANATAAFVARGRSYGPRLSSSSSSSLWTMLTRPFNNPEHLRRKRSTTLRLWTSSSSSSSNSGKDEKGEDITCDRANNTDDTAAGSNDDTNDKDKDDASLAEFRNRLNQRDQVFSAISGDGGIKVTVCTVRNLINDILFNNYQQQQQPTSTATATATATDSTTTTGATTSSTSSSSATAPLTMTAIPTDALGRTMICALLMANGIQPEQMVQITINGNGPLRGVVAICTGEGQLRGYVGTPQLGIGAGSDYYSTKTKNKILTIHDAVGTQGSVQVVKNHPDWPRPYNGITAIRHGDIDRDVGLYLAESEQRSCALAAATALTTTTSVNNNNNKNGGTGGTGTGEQVLLCNAAGGYLIEQLPDVSPETVAIVERNLAKLVELDGSDRLPTNLLLQGQTPLDIAQLILHDLDLQPLGQNALTPSLACECSPERLWRALRLLPATEVQEILELEQKVEARCQFCGREYRITADAVRERLFSRERQ